MGSFLLLILALVAIYFLMKIKLGVFYMAIGMVIAAIVIVFGIYSSINGEKTPASVRANPLTLILRIVLVIAVYFFLCANHMVPENLNFMPTFVSSIF